MMTPGEIDEMNHALDDILQRRSRGNYPIVECGDGKADPHEAHRYTRTWAGVEIGAFCTGGRHRK